jgi:hypothetical protein
MSGTQSLYSPMEDRTRTDQASSSVSHRSLESLPSLEGFSAYDLTTLARTPLRAPLRIAGSSQPPEFSPDVQPRTILEPCPPNSGRRIRFVCLHIPKALSRLTLAIVSNLRWRPGASAKPITVRLPECAGTKDLFLGSRTTRYAQTSLFAIRTSRELFYNFVSGDS